MLLHTGTVCNRATLAAWISADLDLILLRPRCPQVDVDVRHLLRIPEDFPIEKEPEDEFECLNLDITCPPASLAKGPLPVLLWIYGMSWAYPQFILSMDQWLIMSYRRIAGGDLLLSCIEDLR